jgi:hypothetical protein
MVFAENTAQPKTVNKPEVRQHNSKHQRNDKVRANHIFVSFGQCDQAPHPHSYSWRPFDPDGTYNAPAMPTPGSFSKRLMAGGLVQEHAGKLWVENLKTREIVENLSEELVRFLEPTKVRVCSAGKMQRQEPHNWRTWTGNGALSEVAQNMYQSSVTTSTDRENTTFRVRARSCL